MKTTICSFAFAAVLTVVSTANAAVMTNDNTNYETLQKTYCYTTIDGRHECSQSLPFYPSDPVDPGDSADDGHDAEVVDGYLEFNQDLNFNRDWDSNTATVSSCPSGMTKSSDGCCCLNN